MTVPGNNPMTVADFMAKLSKYPPEMRILMTYETGYFEPGLTVTEPDNIDWNFDIEPFEAVVISSWDDDE